MLKLGRLSEEEVKGERVGGLGCGGRGVCMWWEVLKEVGATIGTTNGVLA